METIKIDSITAGCNPCQCGDYTDCFQRELPDFLGHTLAGELLYLAIITVMPILSVLCSSFFVYWLIASHFKQTKSNLVVIQSTILGFVSIVFIIFLLYFFTPIPAYFEGPIFTISLMFSPFVSYLFLKKSTSKSTT